MKCPRSCAASNLRAIRGSSQIASHARGRCVRAHHILRVRREGSARFRQPDASPGPLEQLTAELPAERRDRGGHRRLGDHELVRGGSHRAAPNDREERRQLGPVIAIPLRVNRGALRFVKVIQVTCRRSTSGAADVDRAVQAAHAAFPAWAALGPAGRASYLHRLADLIDANVDRLAAVECADMAAPAVADRACHRAQRAQRPQLRGSSVAYNE